MKTKTADRTEEGAPPPGGGAINDSDAIIECMASITIRRLDDSVKARLRMRAARHGRPMEEEARQVLTAALKEEPKRSKNLVESIRELFGPQGGVELEIPPRGMGREPPDFEWSF